MARINLHIEADSAEDLKAVLAALAGAQNYEATVVHTPATALQWGDKVTITDVAEAAAETAKRTRRTKAQIEADNAAAKPAAQDPFQEQVRQSAAEVAAEKSTDVTPAHLRAAAAAWMQKDGHSAKKLQDDILVPIGGAPNIGGVPAEKYAAVLAALEA